ncbi:diaphorase [Capsaspora owczarzaki ATCC 30864]|uniref:NADH-cytochrome b5 reductase n=1 Tax=Capsaspora owczarzaki (strain ATCC 30864) TaxID=595528 RepID=A0A0D2WJT5_CAPO3|nr:diaphorase [Capsaspora owczarzaki ATCC 30864]KJE89688.1 diaphorase [Capsaspora owczarzaki ATCC 30864]|eukprot:XP_004365992.2 diaphorase [Capsaspora owczarzaki ATCC 30864]
MDSFIGLLQSNSSYILAVAAIAFTWMVAQKMGGGGAPGSGNSRGAAASCPFVNSGAAAASSTSTATATNTEVASAAAGQAPPKLSPGHPRVTAEGRLIALDPENKIAFKLVKKEHISHDTRRFRFALQSPEHVLGLPIGKHMNLSANIGDQLVVRPYTPTSSDDDLGYFELVVKVYFKNVHPKFPEGGKMSQYLEGLRIGDTVDVIGPKGRITYQGNGRLSVCEINKPEAFRQAKHFGLIAGGTGITPMLQVIAAVLKNPKDTTTLSLLFANQTENDILVRDMLEQYARDHPTRFKVWYTLDKAPAGWKFSEGFINADMIAEHLPAATPDAQILMCGPPPMINFACIPNLEKLGFTAEQFLKF